MIIIIIIRGFLESRFGWRRWLVRTVAVGYGIELTSLLNWVGFGITVIVTTYIFFVYGKSSASLNNLFPRRKKRKGKKKGKKYETCPGNDIEKWYK